MHWLSILLIGIASNLDNLGIGVAYGVRSIKIPFLSNLIIAIIGMIVTYLSDSLGNWIGTYISRNIANLSGGILLILIGGWTIWTGIKKSSSNSHKPNRSNHLQQILKNPEKADTDQDQVISLKESVLLGLALSLNCLGTGFGGGIAGIPPLWSGLSVGLFSFMTIEIGVHMGLRISNSWINKYSNTLAGLLLVGIGLYEIIT